MYNWNDQFDLLIKSRTPLIFIRSREEERVEALINQAAKRLSPRRVATWDYIKGLQGLLNSNSLGAKQPMAVLQWLQNLDNNNPTILLVKDFRSQKDCQRISMTPLHPKERPLSLPKRTHSNPNPTPPHRWL